MYISNDQYPIVYRRGVPYASICPVNTGYGHLATREETGRDGEQFERILCAGWSVVRRWQEFLKSTPLHVADK